MNFWMWKNCYCFTNFLIQFASGEKRGHWTPDFWYRMWDSQPMASQILNSKNMYWILASFVANQKKIVSLVVVFLCQNYLKYWKWKFVKLCCDSLVWPLHSIASRFSVCNLQMAKRKTSEYWTLDTECGITHPCFHEFSIL